MVFMLIMAIDRLSDMVCDLMMRSMLALTKRTSSHNNRRREEVETMNRDSDGSFE